MVTVTVIVTVLVTVAVMVTVIVTVTGTLAVNAIVADMVSVTFRGVQPAADSGRFPLLHLVLV